MLVVGFVPSDKMPPMACSLPTDMPIVPGLDNVPRTPRTPHARKDSDKEPRFYPVVKDTSASHRDPQVSRESYLT